MLDDSRVFQTSRHRHVIPVVLLVLILVISTGLSWFVTRDMPTSQLKELEEFNSAMRVVFLLCGLLLGGALLAVWIQLRSFIWKAVIDSRGLDAWTHGSRRRISWSEIERFERQSVSLESPKFVNNIYLRSGGKLQFADDIDSQGELREEIRKRTQTAPIQSARRTFSMPKSFLMIPVLIVPLYVAGFFVVVAAVISSFYPPGLPVALWLGLACVVLVLCSGLLKECHTVVVSEEGLKLSALLRQYDCSWDDVRSWHQPRLSTTAGDFILDKFINNSDELHQLLVERCSVVQRRSWRQRVDSDRYRVQLGWLTWIMTVVLLVTPVPAIRFALLVAGLVLCFDLRFDPRGRARVVLCILSMVPAVMSVFFIPDLVRPMEPALARCMSINQSREEQLKHVNLDKRFVIDGYSISVPKGFTGSGTSQSPDGLMKMWHLPNWLGDNELTFTVINTSGTKADLPSMSEEWRKPFNIQGKQVTSTERREIAGFNFEVTNWVAETTSSRKASIVGIDYLTHDGTRMIGVRGFSRPECWRETSLITEAACMSVRRLPPKAGTPSKQSRVKRVAKAKTRTARIFAGKSPPHRHRTLIPSRSPRSVCRLQRIVLFV